jgi:hypothetical protein
MNESEIKQMGIPGQDEATAHFFQNAGQEGDL